MAIYFTADTHLGHKNIIDYCIRPFSTVEEMDQAIIDNWNSVIGSKDTVYHLGDFSLGGFEQFVLYIMRLNGRIKIVPGGHDYRWIKGGKEFVAPSNTGHFAELLPALCEIKHNKRTFVLCHYPIESWRKKYYGSIHLHGHSHGNLEKKEKNRIDVGIDCWKYYPVSLEKIILNAEE